MSVKYLLFPGGAGRCGYVAAAVLAMALLTPSLQSATTFSFHCIGDADSDTGNADVGKSQVPVTRPDEMPPGLVTFRFAHSGPAASSVCDVYFHNAPPRLLASFASSGGSRGVAFSSPTHPGEWLTTTLNSASHTKTTCSSVLDDLREDGGWRTGRRVPGCANGGSEPPVGNPQPVPAPAGFSGGLVLLGILGVGGLLRSRRSSAG